MKKSHQLFDLESAPSEWIDWILLMIMKGVPNETILSRCISKGLSEEISVKLLGQITASPLLKYCVRYLEVKGKQESLLRMLTRLENKRDIEARVQEHRSLDKNSFFNDFYFLNKPVKLVNTLKSVLVNRNWDPNALAEEFANLTVEVCAGDRWIASPPYKRNPKKVKILFHEFVESILRSDENPFYLTSENPLLATNGFTPLFESLSGDCEFLDFFQMTPETVKLWMGPKGTHTRLHHDKCNVLLGQLFGKKRVTLCSSKDLPKLANDYGCFSPYTFESSTHPLSDVRRYTVELSAGEALFIPVGWWHEVIAETTSISVSYMNFAVEDIYNNWDGIYWIRHCAALEK